VKDIGLVVNYDLPEQTEDYVHRIGRTGRAGKSGRAVSFATPDQKFDIVAIERLIKRPIPTTHHKGAALPVAPVGAPIGDGRAGTRGGAVGGYGPRRFDRRAPPGAFQVHTNQPFKGGAPKGYVPRGNSSAPRSATARPAGAHAWQRPAASAGRPSYAGPSRGASASYGPSASHGPKRAFNSGRPSFGARPPSGGARPPAAKPFRTDPSFVAGFKGGYQGSKPRPAGSDFKAGRTGGAPRPGGSFRRSR
jgi:ATP-dependent RNA helicase RhlE